MWREDTQPEPSSIASALRYASELDRAFELDQPNDPAHTPEAESAHAPDHTHDPGEVTIQLDMSQARAANGSLRSAGGEGDSGPRITVKPVFVDESGRRSRRLRRLGIGVGAVCALYAGVIAATLLSGNSDAPWLPVPGQQEDAPASEVQPSPTASRSGVTGSGADATAGPDATAGGGTSSATKSDSGTPNASAGAATADGTGTARPSASGATVPAAGGETAGSAGPSESSAASPSANASDDIPADPSPTPSESTEATDPGPEAAAGPDSGDRAPALVT